MAAAVWELRQAVGQQPVELLAALQASSAAGSAVQRVVDQRLELVGQVELAVEEVQLAVLPAVAELASPQAGRATLPSVDGRLPARGET